jgi:hypothetical protein
MFGKLFGKRWTKKLVTEQAEERDHFPDACQESDDGTPIRLQQDSDAEGM